MIDVFCYEESYHIRNIRPFTSRAHQLVASRKGTWRLSYSRFTNDSFDRERGKLNVVNNVLERVEAVKATGLADKIIIEDYFGQKIDDVQKYDADIFAIGSDWEDQFDYLNEYCKVVYLPRTEGISST